METPRPSHLLPGLAALALMLACGGGSSSAPATAGAAGSLAYTAPQTSGYRLVRDGSSTPGHLVLNLVGPQGDQIRGVVLTLAADGGRAAWAHAGGSDPYLKEGQALALGDGARLLKSRVDGQNLQAAVFQKGAAAPAVLNGQAILSVALDLRAGATKGAVVLSSAAAQILDAQGKTQTITVAVGTLTAE